MAADMVQMFGQNDPAAYIEDLNMFNNFADQ